MSKQTETLTRSDTLPGDAPRHPAKTARPLRGRSILLLQGLATPFFGMLATRLAGDSAQVHKVHFCGGDLLFRGKAHSRVIRHIFRGKPDDLGAYYEGLVQKHDIDTILLFGDCRPVHGPARELANRRKIALYVFDEGYIRPGFITMEASGTNGYSLMPRHGGEIARLAQKALFSGKKTPPIQTNMGRRARMDILAHGANFLLWPWFRQYRGHRPEPVWREALGWGMRALRGLIHDAQNRATIDRMETADKPYFMVPLQLNSDYQIRCHSPFSGMPAFIEHVMASFARHAPADHHLFFKNHPLDNGLINYRRIIRTLAHQHSITHRVSFAAGGNLDRLIERSAGLVLVNSTVGVAALRLGRPLKALGTAIYDMAGLTDQQPLDRFWQNPVPPQQKLADEFLAVVETYTQIRGDLFSDAGIACAVDEAARVVAGTLPRLPSA